jgi:alanyl-tRNA synthetase
MKKAYPEIAVASAARVPDIVLAEEKRFGHTLALGQAKLDSDLIPLLQYQREYEKKFLDVPHLERQSIPVDKAAQEIELESARKRMTYGGERAFRLLDTYGMPRDFIEDICRDAGIPVDWAGFEKAMEELRRKARASWKGTQKETANPAFRKLAETFKTEPGFYFGTTAKDCRIEAILPTAKDSTGSKPAVRRRCGVDGWGNGRSGA